MKAISKPESNTGKNSMSKDEKWSKSIGKRCMVEGFGEGVFLFYGEVDTEEGSTTMCGVELDKPKGDGDGAGYFVCKDGHAVFAYTKEVKFLNADGKPIIRKAAKSSKTAKKWESPPSLRKTINRGGKSTPTRSAVTTTKKASTPKKSAGTKDARKTSKTKDSTEEKSVPKRSVTNTEEVKKEDAPSSNAVKRPPKPTPEEEEARKAAEAAAEEKAIEERLAEANRRQQAEEEAFLKKSEAENLKREQARAERRAQREKEAAERQARLNNAEKEAMEEIAAVQAAHMETQAKFQDKNRLLQEKREAQRARLAQLMASVKGV
eukprot:m.47276 g.47276  ORF g.47276 m.47276 type:complete len:321 (+) comp10476_c0_seq1:203-1165(+)